MEITDCAKIILERINKFDPVNAIRIIGYLLLYCDPEDLMQYALASDKQMYSVASEVKAILDTSLKPSFSSHPSFRVPAWQPPLSSDISHTYNDGIGIIHKETDLVNLEHLPPLNPLSPNFSGNYNYSDVGFGSRASLRSAPSMIDYTMKPCQYFYSGLCRHGTSCRYSHGQSMSANFATMYNLGLSDLLNDDHDFHPGSLETLDVEIGELLKERNGVPVSIASLPMIYFAKYGKTLQADGYLTESQRHGKAGYSLTKLLARLQNIRLIDRPHGQHSVVLAEDAAKYIEFSNERSDAGSLHASSNQIYLTFPPESTFTGEDVMDYFMQFGPVRDVRIPQQEKRMFGFVSFHFSETVKTILGDPHPHNICGSRVLVKPYKEKTNIYDRKHLEKVELPTYHPSNCYIVGPDINTGISENSRMLNKQLMTGRERAFENQRMRVMEMQLTSEHLTPQHSQQYSSFAIEDLKIYEDSIGSIAFPENNGSGNGKPELTVNNYSKQESGTIELPDSPFAYSRA